MRQGRPPRAIQGVFLAALFAGSRPAAIAGDLPRPAAFRGAFEAEYPKTEVSGTALELESLAASFGLDLVPQGVEPPAPEPHPAKEASSGDAAPAIRPERRRARPEESAAREFLPVAALAGQFTDREVRTSQEKIGAPPPPLERFLEEHEGALSAVRAALLRREDVAWEMDVARAAESPLPNLLGIMRLQRLLLSRALLEARAEKAEDAVETLEACWGLNGALRSRPELICQLILLAVAKVQIGVLRKIDAPAYGWADRLRESSFAEGYVAAFENQVWFIYPDLTDLSEKEGAWGRILRRVGEDFRSRSSCESTRKTVEASAAEARAQEADDAEELEAGPENMPSLVDGFLRARRCEIDAELTALVIDARLEREASRRRRWPEKLLSVGNGACPDQKWFYRAMDNGTARFAFEGRIDESDSPALRMPFEFVAGKPSPPRRSASKKPPL